MDTVGNEPGESIVEDVRQALSSGRSAEAIATDFVASGFRREEADRFIRDAQDRIKGNRWRDLLFVLALMIVGLGFWIAGVATNFYPLYLGAGLFVVTGVARLALALRGAKLGR